MPRSAQGDRQGNDSGSQYRLRSHHRTADGPGARQPRRHQEQLNSRGYGAITTEIKADQTFYFAEPYHQQYLAKPGSRPYCSAMPTQTSLGDFKGAGYRLPSTIWAQYDWSISHCVLRSDNSPIALS